MLKSNTLQSSEESTYTKCPKQIIVKGTWVSSKCERRTVCPAIEAANDWRSYSSRIWNWKRILQTSCTQWSAHGYSVIRITRVWSFHETRRSIYQFRRGFRLRTWPGNHEAFEIKSELKVKNRRTFVFSFKLLNTYLTNVIAAGTDSKSALTWTWVALYEIRTVFICALSASIGN